MKFSPLRILLVCVLVITAILVAYPRNSTTFDITAESEYVRYSPDPAAAAVHEWELDSAVIFVGDDSVGRVVSGALKFTDPVVVTIERLSSGPLSLKLEAPRERADNAGEAPVRVGEFEEHSKASISLYGNVTIAIANVEERSHAGKPLVFAVEGALQTGRAIHRETDPHIAILRSGKITKLAKAIVGSTVFTAGSRDLDPGDEVSITAPDSSQSGLIRADERPALTVVYRAVARSVRVGRPGGGEYPVGMSMAERAAADPFLQRWWATLIFLISLLGTWKALGADRNSNERDE
ncbi:hypothetical protein [Longimicrobium terrae]|uniref:Uncharacterized protein n=1 Tax=Longimicrobium terrae TaxID=1639882 RepID=A0A841H3D9_9BACT|nr:hypothetical protein [Longimicrobium terrae]MBB4638148.1 hypothetical protein [Longimicrobium terrae]MBB6072520.1 hypothetical protein [Longimicrobium terrae]NNC32072.1 hypothetical protein [Longimicrobium terrae]